MPLQLTIIKQAWDVNPNPFATIHLKGLLDSWALSTFAASTVTLGRVSSKGKDVDTRG